VTENAPPGWYRSETDAPGIERWWDGEQWSAQLRNAPPQRPAGNLAPIPRNNGLAVASLVLGILWVYWIGSILAVVFGHRARRQIDESDGTQAGRGMATAGMVLGYVGIGFLVLGVLAVIAASAGGRL
jgi:hypothetical protein